MLQGVTPSEKFVTSLCQRSFLKLWTHPNPKGKNDKELCDCLVVCEDDIVIISVKENEYKDTGDTTGWERWQKAAIEKSASQIWGAERWLTTVDRFTRHDGRVVTLPEKSKRRYHRISVSLGAQGHVPLKWGDLGNGFVHLFDEYSVGAAFGTLDTITDFVEYLRTAEDLISKARLIFAGGGVEDLVALYLGHGRSFNFEDESQPDMIILNDDLWKGYSESEEYRAIQEDLKGSYLWDELVEFYTEDLLSDGMFDMQSKEVTDDQHALVVMALQPRMYRAGLAKAFKVFLDKPELKVGSRAAQGYRETAFVFLVGKSSDREQRMKELSLRCLVIRGRVKGVKTVVGIATDRPGVPSEAGYSTDLAYIHLPEWTEDREAQVSGIQTNLGYFRNLS